MSPFSDLGAAVIGSGSIGTVHIEALRLESDKGGELDAVGDIGSHWLDLTSFITGQRAIAVMAKLATFVKTRRPPAGPVETFAAERAADPVAREMTNEDAALILLRDANGACGTVAIGQISPGDKDSLQWQVDGSVSAAWCGTWRSPTISGSAIAPGPPRCCSAIRP